MAAVSFRRVSKVFEDGTQALVNLDLDVGDGEFMVLVGPSGCGKTTALRLLAGLEEPTEGEVVIEGEVVNGWSPQRRNVAMVFQNYALYPHMTVRANLEFPLRMARMRREEIGRRVSRAADVLDLSGLLDRKPGELSGGQRQRVAMGRAIVRDPRVFLMDEPLSNLDARLRTQIRADISALQRRFGTTTVYVTHDQVEAMTLGDRVAVMNGGLVQQVDAPRRLYERPANTFVAGFVGSPGMNLFRTRLDASAGGLSVHLGDSRLPLPPETVVECPQLAAHAGAPLLAGLRPEAFSRADESPWSIDVSVQGLEALGHEALVYFLPSWPVEKPLVARLPGRPGIAPEGRLNLGIDPSGFYFFRLDGSAIY